jgi:hypothetical protein
MSPKKKRKLELNGGIMDPDDVFGYEYQNVEYNLSTFQRIADAFEEEYFEKISKRSSECRVIPRKLRIKLARNGGKRRFHNVNYSYHKKGRKPFTIEDKEAEFWRIVEDGREVVDVQYGSDVDVLRQGTAFPKSLTSDWNLNKLPGGDKSFLKLLHGKIAGINSPMMYVGMLFSTFCWHTEDNYLYSTNFIHTGAPKVWYGVPSSSAYRFEEIMRAQLPHLFKVQPNLIHALVTMLSPRILQQAGVTVSRMVCYEGEYAITFPQAFHAGFNIGFNMAESVNFALPDWISYGRLAVDDYVAAKRGCAFSHDQLVYNGAIDKKMCEKMSMDMRNLLRIDLKSLIEKEKRLLHEIYNSGMISQVRMEEGPRNEVLRKSKNQKENNLCHVCSQDCFFSGVFCECNFDVTCLRHFRDQCHCGSSKIFIKHGVKELEALYNGLCIKK